MEIERIEPPQVADGGKEFKQNFVQEILSDSLSEEEDNHQSVLFSRLYPSMVLIPHNTNGNISILTDHLILTSAVNVVPHIIDALEVTCVISAAPELPDIPLDSAVTYHKVDIMDSPNSNISRYLDQAADLIDEVASVGGRTMVFCVAGVSRSASICIAYLMKHHRLSLLEAYDYVKMRRPRIRPNCGFFKQLIEYEKTLFGSGRSTVRMVFNEFVQTSIPDVYDHEYKALRSVERRKLSRYRQH